MASRSKIIFFTILSFSLFSLKALAEENKSINPAPSPATSPSLMPIPEPTPLISNMNKDNSVASPAPNNQDNTKLEENLAKNKGKANADRILYEKNFKLIKLLGNAEVKIKDNKDDIIIKSEELFVDQDTNKVYTNKNFTITNVREMDDNKGGKTKKTTVINGKEFDFDLETRRLVVKFASLDTEAEIEGKKLYIKGDEIVLYNKGDRLSVVNGNVTTCDLSEKNEHAHISIEAESFEIVPDNTIFAWSPILKMGNNNIYWLPFIYMPLKKDSLSDFKTSTGKNEVEGMFLDFKSYYKLNDYHDGNWFFRLMSKKLLNIGLEHYWVAEPNSNSYGFLYVNPYNMDYNSYSAEDKKTTREYFRDYHIYLKHEQWIPFIPYNKMDFSFEKKDFYNPSAIYSSRDAKQNFIFNDSYNDIFQIAQDVKLFINPTFSYNLNNTDTYSSPTPNTNEVSKITSNSDSASYKLSNTFTLDNPLVQKLNLGFSSSYDTNSTFAMKDSTKKILKDNSYLSNYRDNLSLNPSLNFEILPGLNFTSNFQYLRANTTNYINPNDANNTNINTNTDNYKPNFTQSLVPDISLTQSLSDWGSLSLKASTRNEFWEYDVYKDLYPKDKDGKDIDVSKLKDSKDASDIEIYSKRTKALDKIKNSSNVTVLPELTLDIKPFSSGITDGIMTFFNPILRDLLPFDTYRELIKNGEKDWLFKDKIPLSTRFVFGNYFEHRRLNPEDKTGIKNVSKADMDIRISGVDIDLGLGNKLNFNNTGYRQIFYNTQDAQYSITGAVNYKNDFFKAFAPNISYSRTLIDKDSNTPLLSDNLGKNKAHSINGGFSLFNIPELTLNFTGLSYDFENKNYSPSVSFSLDSQFEAGAIFNIKASTSYNIKTISETEAKGKTTQYKDKAELTKDIKAYIENDTTGTSGLKDDAFSLKYLGYTKEQVQKDLDKLTEEQLYTKYSKDSRILDLRSKKTSYFKDSSTNDYVLYKLTDAGNIDFRNSYLQPINLNFSVSVPWEWESDNDRFFGESKNDIPWGIGANFITYFDPSKYDFYENPSSFDKKLLNIRDKFSNTGLEMVAVTGGNWLTHTKFKLKYTLSVPELLEEGKISAQKNRPIFPFDGGLSLAIKKDFHDFILYLDFGGIYEPTVDRYDFKFNVNLELTAFPNAFNELRGNIDQNLKKVDSVSKGNLG
ncbi:MAG: hypothetical protein U0457_21250 [Candidatus Sericytochromatia bacterium]